MKATDLTGENTAPSILIYGAAGAGKTGLVSQAARGFMFDFDNGMRTAITLKDALTPLRQQIEFERFVDTTPGKPTAWLSAKRKLFEIIDSSSKKDVAPKYDAVIIDSLTGMSDAVYNQVMAQVGKPLIPVNSATSGMFGRPEMQEWGFVVNEIECTFKLLRSLRVLVLVTAHEMLLDIDGTNVSRILCSGTKLPGKLPYLFDEIWYAKANLAAQGKYEYVVSGRSTGAIQTRTRSGFRTDVVHNDIGLSGVLKLIGFNY